MVAAEAIAALRQDGLSVRPLQEIHKKAAAKSGAGRDAAREAPLARSAAPEPR